MSGFQADYQKRDAEEAQRNLVEPLQTEPSIPVASVLVGPLSTFTARIPVPRLNVLGRFFCPFVSTSGL